MIWTACHWSPALAEAYRVADMDAIKTLREHHIHAYHCGGYDAAAWPCPTAAKVLNDLLGGAA